jgi:hypothetical protein
MRTLRDVATRARASPEPARPSPSTRAALAESAAERLQRFKRLYGALREHFRNEPDRLLEK